MDEYVATVLMAGETKPTELKNFEEDLSKTYISFTEINELGTYKKI